MAATQSAVLQKHARRVCRYTSLDLSYCYLLIACVIRYIALVFLKKLIDINNWGLVNDSMLEEAETFRSLTYTRPMNCLFHFSKENIQPQSQLNYCGCTRESAAEQLKLSNVFLQ